MGERGGGKRERENIIFGAVLLVERKRQIFLVP